MQCLHSSIELVDPAVPTYMIIGEHVYMYNTSFVALFIRNNQGIPVDAIKCATGLRPDILGPLRNNPDIKITSMGYRVDIVDISAYEALCQLKAKMMPHLSYLRLQSQEMFIMWGVTTMSAYIDIVIDEKMLTLLNELQMGLDISVLSEGDIEGWQIGNSQYGVI